MKPKYDLEDYIYSVESRSLEPSADPDDVYAQLQQKEKDLILAAELGKALLEKNEELSRQNERLAEDYSQKLEVLSQITWFPFTKTTIRINLTVQTSLHIDKNRRSTC
jgi:coiled-coil domain-containing protein 64